MAKSYKYNRSRKPLSLTDCKLRITDAVKEMERIILDRGTDQQKIQACHAMAGLINRFARLIEVNDLEERITALEEKQLRKVS